MLTKKEPQQTQQGIEALGQASALWGGAWVYESAGALMTGALKVIAKGL